MMDYDRILSKKATEMRPSGIRKFFNLAAEMPHCISLGVGEPDFRTPWTIRDTYGLGFGSRWQMQLGFRYIF